MTSDEQAVRELLQPLRELAPVTRGAAAARPAGRRWGEALKLAGIALAAVALVAAIALLAHRSRRPAPAAPPPHPSVLTFLSEGGIAELVPGTATDRWLVSNPYIRGFGWSPDGNRLAYLTGSGTAASGCTMRIRTMASGKTAVVGRWVSHSEPLADGCGSVIDQVRWSPDGRFVAYTEQGHLFVADVARRTARHVVDVKGFGITWWPGGRIAYPCRYADTVSAIDWCAVRPDGSGRIALPVHGLDVTWSPPSGRVAYLLDPGGNRGGGRLHVWLTTPAGRDDHRLFAQRTECCFNLGPYLEWSPDGTRLIVVGVDADIVDAATGASRKLDWWTQVSSQAGPSGHPSWRP